MNVRLLPGLTMDLRGCEVALAAAVPLEVEGPGGRRISVPVAPVGVVALLKMIAFEDNPGVREKDLLDLVRIARCLTSEDAEARLDLPMVGFSEPRLQDFVALGVEVEPGGDRSGFPGRVEFRAEMSRREHGRLRANWRD